MKLFGKSKTPQRNSNQHKNIILLFVLQLIMEMEEQGRKLSKWEVEKFYIISKSF